MKFKVGDLVVLSAAGERLNQNDHAVGGWGIITEIGLSYANFPLMVEWYGGSQETTLIRFKPYELKYFKKLP